MIGEPVPAIFDGREICEADESAVEAAVAGCPMLVRLAMTFARIDEEWGLGD